MEKYVIDLDKVLDELEQHDNEESNKILNMNITENPSKKAHNSIDNYPKYYDMRPSNKNSIYNFYEKIDVKEADFSIQSKPPKILNSIHSVNLNVDFNQNNEFSNTSCFNNLIDTDVNLNSKSFFNDEKNNQDNENCSQDLFDCSLQNTENVNNVQFFDSTTPNYLNNKIEVSKINDDLILNEINNNKEITLSSDLDSLNGNDNADQSVINNAIVDSDKSSNISLDNKPSTDIIFNDSKEDYFNNELNKNNLNKESCSLSSNIIQNLNSVCDTNCDESISVTNCEENCQNELIIKTDIDNSSKDSNVQCFIEEKIDSSHHNSDKINLESESNVLNNENNDILEIPEYKESEKSINSTSNKQLEIEDDSNLTVSCSEDNSSKHFSSLDINNMSEAELDKYLDNFESESLKEDENISNVIKCNSKMDSEISNSSSCNLNDHDENISASFETCKIIKENDNSLNLINSNEQEIKMDQHDLTIHNSNSNELNNPNLEEDHNIPDSNIENCENDESTSNSQIISLQSSSEQINSQNVPESSSSNDDVSQSVDPANRGGLVQNIAYFERQEMPNGLTEEEQMLGKVKPFWVPDEDAQNCLHCDSKFTLIKRRHHCRSCGKVLCSHCCNFKAKLAYLENKEARVCQLCYIILMKIEEIERINGHPIDISDIASTSTPVNNELTISFPDPNNPAEYCSTVSPFEQASGASTRPPPTVMVPVGVLKRPGSSSHRKGGSSSESSQQGERTGETVKQVMFSDGVRPGGDLVESPGPSRLPEDKPISRAQLQLKPPTTDKSRKSMGHSSKRIKPSRVVVVDNNNLNLPPIINYNELKLINPNLPSRPTYLNLLECLKDVNLPSVTFGITKNLFINAKLISKLCCNSGECWSFSTRGLASVGQDEVILILDCNSLKKPVAIDDECDGSGSEVMDFPRDVFRLFTSIYDSASTASLYTELSHIFLPDGIFGNKDNSGFIFVRPTLQCFQNLLVPSPPFLIALLIHKWEIPWAKVFPLRLVFRLGFEYKMYPTPVISYANRKAVFFEIGHTIMNVLADFRNFQYTLSVVKDMLIHVEERKRVNLLIPKLSYEKVCKVLSTCNEHVLAFGGNFSLKADSHFVCVQNEQDDDVHGQYHTQVINYPSSVQKITGASFIVFSGALKSSTGLKAKMNIVEDGLLVQIPPSKMEELRVALRDMKNFKIECCKISENETSEEWVQINWVNEELSTNLGVRSPIDGLNLEGVQSARIFSSPDYANERFLIRWMEVFFLQINENSRRSEMLNTNRLADSVSQAFCISLIDYLDQLYDTELTKIGLRISLDVDKVGYEVGSGGKPLPAQFTNPLDNALIPAIMENTSTTGIEDPLVIELLFYILLK